MRLALISQTYPPMVSGISVAVRQLSQALAGRGHAVLVLTASDCGRPYEQDQEGVHLVRLRSRPTPSRVGQRWCWWREAEIRTRLAPFQPDLIHLHDPLLGAFLIPGIAHRMGLPLVITAHALPENLLSIASAPPGASQVGRAALWALAASRSREFAAVITPAGYTARQYSAHAGTRAVVISNGVNLERFQPFPTHPGEGRQLALRYGLDPALPIILHVGRLDHEKRVDDVMCAAALAMQRVEAQLLVVGDGNARRSLERLSRKLGIEARTAFSGFVSRDGDLPGLYRLGRVFVLASRIEAEGIVVLEAAASGLPIVAVRATSMVELIEGPACGFLVEPSDLTAMADRLVSILVDKDVQDRLGRAARSMATQHTLQRSVELHEALYQRVIERARAARPAAA